jgi:hypothetical protein
MDSLRGQLECLGDTQTGRKRQRERPRLLNKQTDFIIISHARDSWDLHMYEYMYTSRDNEI